MLGIHGIVLSTYHECGDCYFRKPFTYIPVRQPACDTKFTGALHGDIKRLIHFGKRTIYRLWPLCRWQTQDMLFIIIGHKDFHVLGICIGAPGFHGIDGIHQCRVHLLCQYFIGVFAVIRTTRHHIGNDQCFQVLLVLQGILHGQDTAPGMTQQVKVIFRQPQSSSDLFYFFHKTREIPVCRVIRVIRETATKLVIIYEFNPFLWQEVFEALEVFMRTTRTTIEQQDFSLGIITEPFGPDLEFFSQAFNFNQFDISSLHT